MLNAIFRSPRARPGFSAVSLLFLTLSVSPPSFAQDESATVWSINASNGRLSIVDFEAGTTTVVNDDANMLTNPRALAYRDDGGGRDQVLVADTLAGSILIYAGGAGIADTVINESLTGKPLQPDGIDIDSLGNLFGVSSSPGEPLPAQVWALERDALCPDPFRPDCLDGGYKLPLRILDPQMIVDGIEIRQLSESRISREAHGPIDAGDLIVLAQEPAMALLYRRQSATDPDIQDVLAGTEAEMAPEVLIPTVGFPPGAVPNGLAIGPDGNLLISTGGGIILRFAPDGTRLMPDFANGLGNGKFKIEVASDAGAFKAYVADRNGAKLLRFNFEPDGTGTLDGIVTDGVQFPEDLVTSTGNTIPTPAGSNIALSASSVLRTIIEEVLAAGATSATAVALPDIPDTIPNVGRLLSELDPTNPTLPDILIPSYIRGQDNSVGVPTFVLVIVESNLPFFGILQHSGDGARVLNVDLDCNAADPALVPQMAWAADELDPMGPEGNSFVNISNGCGTSRGGGIDFSYFFIDHSDERIPVDIVSTKFGHLDTVMVDASLCVAGKVFNRLSTVLTSAERNFSKGRLSRARNDMLKFEAKAAASPGDFSACTGDDANMFGDLRSRALSIAYQLGR